MLETMRERITRLALEQARMAPAASSGLETDAITLDTSLRRDLGLDSLRMVSFLFRCGEELGIDPSDLVELIAVEQIRTIGDVVAMGTRITGGEEAAPAPAVAREGARALSFDGDATTAEIDER